MLEVKNVFKSFKDKTVLRNLSLEVQEGSIFGLVGVNGAGKTTLLRTICGVFPPEEGEVLLDGYNTFKEADIRKDLLFVSDDMYLPNVSNIRALKQFYGSFYDLNEEAYQKYLKVFDLSETQPFAGFSKGMKRQASLLFALAIRPKLLLLDECFDGLDPIVRLNFKKALVDLLEDQKSIVIISSHNLKELEDICDSFGILDNGQINTYGDLLESKDMIWKYQLAFKEEVDKAVFAPFDIMNYKHEGTVYTLVIKGEKEEVKARLEELHPLLLNELPVNFEELFIYEVESRGMLNE